MRRAPQSARHPAESPKADAKHGVTLPDRRKSK